MTRAGLILRVSDPTQGLSDRLSLDAQRRVLRELCQRNGWEVVREYVGVGESAFTNDIRKRQTMLDVKSDVEQHVVDVLAVHDLSRYARDEELGHAFYNLLERNEIKLVNASSDVDYSTPEGRMMLSIDLGLGSYWSRKMSFHIKKSMRERFELGLHVGDVPFGYRRGETTKHPLMPVPQEAAAVAEAVLDYAAGAGYTEIARRWNAQGLRPHSKQGHTTFTVSAMQSIIENDFYAGFVHYKGERRRGAHEAIISEDLWLAAQQRVRRQPSHARQPRMLAGLARCSECDGPIHQTKSGTGNRYAYYREPSYLRGEPCANAGGMWRCEHAEAEIDRIIREMARDREWLTQIDREARRLPKQDDGERKELEAKRRRATTAYVEAALSEQEWRLELQAIDDRFARLPTGSPDIIQFAGERLASIGQVWDGMTMEERREACRILFKWVRMDTRGKRLWVRPWPDFEPLFVMRRDTCRGGICVGMVPPAGLEPALRALTISCSWPTDRGPIGIVRPSEGSLSTVLRTLGD